MDLKEFVKNVLIDINTAVDEARQETSRDITFSEKENTRTIEFDVAVSAEDRANKEGKVGIRVLQFAEAGGNISQENKNSTVSRVTFGLRITPQTKEERAAQSAAYSASRSSRSNQSSNFF